MGSHKQAVSRKLLEMSLASMEKHLFNLKFAAKELERCSKKCDKEEKAEKLKLKKAIEKGNHEVARIHAENAIRQKNQSLNYLRMSARVDATASRVQSALTTKKLTKSMEGVVKGMSAALKSMNLEKISGLMDQFEKEFEDLDVQTSVMEGAMSQTTATNIPQDSVEVLMRQAADEAGLEHGSSRTCSVHSGTNYSGISGSGRVVTKTGETQTNLD